MNKVVIVGRLTKDPNTSYTASGKAVSRFTVAVNRKYKSEGQPDADFISCVAFGKTGEFVEKYFSKGKQIALEGSLQTGSYTNKDGQKVYTTDVNVGSVEFVGSKGEGKPQNDNIPEGFEALDDEDMPF